MGLSFGKVQSTFFSRIFSFFIAFSFIFTSVVPPSIAQVSPQVLSFLPVPGTMISATSAYTPTLIKGLRVHPDNALMFDFIVDSGNSGLANEGLKKEANKLIKYFLATLTIPEEELWVNLSPYEQNRIISEGFGDTKIGKDLLAQDYMLKQLMASMMYPEDELGKKFWDQVYSKMYEQYGTTEIPMNTFNKVWIVPEKATVYEHESSAYVVGKHLKVMLEEDYLALQENLSEKKYGLNQVDQADAETISGVSSAVVKEILIPALEKEVNEGKTFAPLRQAYNSMILATWFKKNFKESLLGKVYVDQNKTVGVDTEDKQINQKIYNQYVESFKKGVYNYIRDDIDPANGQVIPRKYFSGGLNINLSASYEEKNQNDIVSSPLEERRKINAELGDTGTVVRMTTNIIEATDDVSAAVRTGRDVVISGSSPVRGDGSEVYQTLVETLEAAAEGKGLKEIKDVISTTEKLEGYFSKTPSFKGDAVYLERAKEVWVVTDETGVHEDLTGIIT